jgi:hypothetical protein
MSRRTAFAGLVLALMAAAFGVAFAIGRSSRTTSEQAQAATAHTRQAAFTRARLSAVRYWQRVGVKQGAGAGHARGELKGKQAGKQAGAKYVAQQQAAQQAARARAAQLPAQTQPATPTTPAGPPGCIVVVGGACVPPSQTITGPCPVVTPADYIPAGTPGKCSGVPVGQGCC